MELSDRKKRILQTVIDEYIDTAEPVGSKTIAENAELGISSATIRNEMAELESMGLLEQPHTSAGRVPSATGYRMYVDELMQRHRLSIEETDAINQTLRGRIRQLDRLIEDSGQALAQLTNYPVFALSTASRLPTIQRIEIIPVEPVSVIAVVMADTGATKSKLMRMKSELDGDWLQKVSVVLNTHLTGLSSDNITQNLISSMERAVGDCGGFIAVIISFVLEVLGELEGSDTYVRGSSRLLEQPEYRNVDRAQKVLNYLSGEEALMKLPPPDEGNNMRILIGPENVAEELRDSSVIIAKYELGDNMQGLVGVVGPTRMDYAKIAAKLGYFAESMTRLLAGREDSEDEDD